METLKQKNTKWVSQLLFTYQNPESLTNLSMTIDSGSTLNEKYGTSYNCTKLNVILRDTRINYNQKVSFEFHIDELVKYHKSLEQTLNNTIEAFNTGKDFTVTKYWFNNKKQINTRFMILNGYKVVRVEITDNTSSIGRMPIIIPFITFNTICQIIKQIKDNYISVSNNLMNICIQERILDSNNLVLEAIKDMKNDLKNINVCKSENLILNTSDEHQIQSNIDNLFRNEKLTLTDFESTDIDIGTDEFVEKIPPKDSSDIQKSFEENFKHFDQEIIPSIDLNIENNSAKNDKPKEIVPQPFIGNYLNFNLYNAVSMMTAFRCVTDKSNSESFCPTEKILNSAGVDHEYKKLILNNNFYKSQYVSGLLMRKNIRNLLNNGSTEKYPFYKFDYNIRKCDGALWKLAAEAAFIHSVYVMFVSANIKSSEDNHEFNSFMNELKLTNSYIKMYLLPFVFSCSESNETFKDAMVDVFMKCKESSAFNELFEKYNYYTGGKMDITLGSYEEYARSYMEDVRGGVEYYDSSNINDIMKRYDIEDSGDLKNSDEVKNTICIKIDKISTGVDSRLQLFIDCAQKYATPSLIEDIKVKCKSYNDLFDIFRTRSIPEMLIKIKRVMDYNDKFIRKSDVFDAVKELSEDPSVTEARVMMEETLLKYKPKEESKHTIEDVIEVYNGITNDF